MFFSQLEQTVEKNLLAYVNAVDLKQVTSKKSSYHFAVFTRISLSYIVLGKIFK